MTFRQKLLMCKLRLLGWRKLEYEADCGNCLERWDFRYIQRP